MSFDARKAKLLAINAGLLATPLTYQLTAGRARIKKDPYRNYNSSMDTSYGNPIANAPWQRSYPASAAVYGAMMPASMAAAMYGARPITRLFKGKRIRMAGDIMRSMAPTVASPKSLAVLAALGGTVGLTEALRKRILDAQVAKYRGGMQKTSGFEKLSFWGALLGGLAAVTPIMAKAIPHLRTAMPLIRGAFQGAKGMSGFAKGMGTVWNQVAKPMGSSVAKWWKGGPTFKPIDLAGMASQGQRRAQSAMNQRMRMPSMPYSME